MQPVERVTCSDMTSPETDAKGIDCRLLPTVFNPERQQNFSEYIIHSAYNQKLDVFRYSTAITKWFEMARCFSAELCLNFI